MITDRKQMMIMCCAMIFVWVFFFSRPILQIFEGKGPMTSTGIEALLYMKTNNSVSSDPGYPDIEILQSFATVAFDTSMWIREHFNISYKLNQIQLLNIIFFI